MAENLGTGVSFTNNPDNFNYDLVVFQKGKPPLDSELNLAQDIQRSISQTLLTNYPSGWLSFKPFNTNPLWSDYFYTQNPINPIPEYALVNGMVINVTNNGISTNFANQINLGAPPTSGNVVQAVYLEVWRSLLDTADNSNRPGSIQTIDAINDIYTSDVNTAWAVGEHGLILATTNAGTTWSLQAINTAYNLNGVTFINDNIGWVVGDEGFIAKTTTKGENWNIVITGLENITTQNLNDIVAVGTTAWAVGDLGTILKSVNDLWSLQNSNVITNLLGVYFKDNLNGWAVGTKGTIIKTTSGGVSWRSINSGTTQDLHSIGFLDLNTGFAVGTNGTILRTSDGGESWVSQSNNTFIDSTRTGITTNYYDLNVLLNLDQYVNGEDVSSQVTGSNSIFTVLNNPITLGDGNGTVSNLPSSVNVTIDGTNVNTYMDGSYAVDGVNGLNGIVTLATAPPIDSAVKIYYYYLIPNEVIRGIGYIVGQDGVVLNSVDLGQTWNKQDSSTSLDLNAVSFTNLSTGWAAGFGSTIIHTTDGSDWSIQGTEALIRDVQLTYFEGNTGTTTYLTDDMINPDAAIETTLRVQVQYNIRITESSDPFAYPDAGLGSQEIVGLGPNSSGSFNFQNMGPITGDFGLYRAVCPNTVDGYSYAIPMFFVNRRNSSPFYYTSNPNGSNTSNTPRPDLLTGDIIDYGDILDVRRTINIPDVTELLNKNFEDLMNNDLDTNYSLRTDGGNRYGTRLLQIDSIGNQGSLGTDIFRGQSITNFSTQGVSSQVIILDATAELDATNTVPPLFSLPALGNTGVYNQNSAQFSAIYDSSGSIYDGKIVPGYFLGFGTNQVIFYFGSEANSTMDDASLTGYVFNYSQILDSTSSLTYIPYQALTVENVSNNGHLPFYYQGVNNNSTGTIINQWNSGISGYPSYVIAYPGSDNSFKASTVELHYFVMLDSSNINSVNEIEINQTNFGSNSDSTYNIYTISNINNITSNYSYKIANIIHSDSGNIIIDSVPGFPFLPNTIVEIVGSVISDPTFKNINNGATVNFSLDDKGINTFCYSVLSNTTINSNGFSCTFYDLNNLGDIIGASSTDTIESLNQFIAWVDNGVNTQIYPISISGFDATSIDATFNTNISGNPTITIQLLVNQLRLYNSLPGDYLLINYLYKPYQSVIQLPLSLTVDLVTRPKEVYISNLGFGGSILDIEPFENPLSNIPLNNLVIDDDSFFNIEPMRFNNFSITGGFAQMPVYVPANSGVNITFTNPSSDVLQRYFYSSCSKDLIYRTEGLAVGAPRKIFIAAIARIVSASDNTFLAGEYVMIVFSRDDFMGLENYTGFIPNKNSAIAIYRLPNKPISRT